MKKDEMKKYEYTLDIFKGTCELNNFEQIGVKCSDNANICKEAFKANYDDERMYFYSEKGVHKVFGAVRKKESIYDVYEMINMAVKFLSNLGIEGVTVGVSGSGKNDIISAMDSVEIVAYDDDRLDDKIPSFAVYIDDEEAIKGVLEDDGYIYFTVDYEAIEADILYKENEFLMDAYISTNEADLLDDAFIIGTELKDAGLKVWVDYSLKQVSQTDVKATFLIILEKEDIEKYQVKLIDMATKEIKTVMIDNLVEELAFI